jgi:hypothetical protein
MSNSQSLSLLYPKQGCKTVTFNNVITYHEPPVKLALELLEYREDDNSKRIVDKLRMKNILNPILDTEHRQKIYLRLNLHTDIEINTKPVS